ncbi:hypothetical protein LOAG_07361 [Loa loa]|uniref:Luc7-like protein 3 n=1 Tax=Loa loa TaxID=7209 RepID=A0A1I7VWD8_LOALO|nr:hypothetical protein LOAG_07361 [Loa loa]EFO21128.1 hypothetical protein LOAG_07361 [Loa loa]
MDEGDDGLKSRSRKHKRNGRNKRSVRKRYQDQRFEDSEGKDDVSCCGRPRRKSESHRRKHHHRHRRHNSKRHHKSQKDMTGTKEEIPSPLRPPTPPLPQPSTSTAVMKEKQKEDKESGEMTSTNQSKISTSGEVTGQGKSSNQVGMSSSPPAPPSRDNQKVEGRESPYQLAIMNKTELLQEFCVTQFIRDGYEISRLAYTTCFPVCKKPNFIYLPQMRFTTNNNVDSAQKKSTQQSGTDLPQETTPLVDNCRNHTSDFSKLLAAGETLNEVYRYDTDTKAIINDLKYLRQLIDRKFTT